MDFEKGMSCPLIPPKSSSAKLEDINVKLYFILLSVPLYMMISAATLEDYQRADVSSYMLNAFKTFGTRLRRRATIQEKRDLSLAYAATNINNKEGTQVKTITVIKNLGDKNTPKLKIKPELHQNEDWANAFKDNFDSYGVIPDVPDVDDLFEYVNKKHMTIKDKKVGKDEEKKPTENPMPKETEKPVFEISSEEISDNEKPIEKIEGDAELLPNFNISRLKTRESLVNFNYSTPKHSVSQYFENYIEFSPNSAKGYEYPKPCGNQQPVTSVTISTPSGKTYNIPENNTNSNVNPYLAPAVTRRPQVLQQPMLIQPPGNASNIPINSLLPPLQQQPQQPNSVFILSQQTGAQQPSSQPFNPSTPQSPIQPNVPVNFPPQQQTLQTPQSQASTSQRPYVAPNLRSNLSGVSRGPGSAPNINIYSSTRPGYRINSYNAGFNRPIAARSRGLKY